MYISEELDETQKEKFQDYLKFALSRVKANEYIYGSLNAYLNDEERNIECTVYIVDEIFLNMESFKKSEKYPNLKEGDWQVKKRKDGTVWVRSLMCLPNNDSKAEKWEIKVNPALIATYMLFPKVRKYAPKILQESLNPDLKNYTTLKKADGGVPLQSFEGINYYEKPYIERVIDYEKEALALDEDQLQQSTK